MRLGKNIWLTSVNFTRNVKNGWKNCNKNGWNPSGRNPINPADFAECQDSIPNEVSATFGLRGCRRYIDFFFENLDQKVG